MQLLLSVIDALLRIASWVAVGKPCEEPTRFCMASQVIVFLMRLVVVCLIYLAVRDLMRSGLVPIFSGLSVAFLMR